MEETKQRSSSATKDWTFNVSLEPVCLTKQESDPKTSKGRICTHCRVWKRWEQFHKKKERYASKCKPCIRFQKKLFRKRLRKKRVTVIEKEQKFNCHVRGNLTPSLVNDVSQIFADAIRTVGR